MSEHPYQEFEDTRYWKVVDQAINDLSENGDIQEMTTRMHIVGYICKLLALELRREPEDNL